MLLNIDRAEPGFQKLQLKDLCLPFVTTVELIAARCGRTMKAILAASDESRRIQAARFISQHSHLIESRENE